MEFGFKQLNFAFWGFAVAVIAYFIPDWQKMALIFSLPLIILYATFLILPESPRYISILFFLVYCIDT